MQLVWWSFQPLVILNLPLVLVPHPRYASLYFAVCTDMDDNELIALELIHLFVETLDQYFGAVCELDLIFNFHSVRQQRQMGYGGGGGGGGGG